MKNTFKKAKNKLSLSMAYAFAVVTFENPLKGNNESLPSLIRSVADVVARIGTAIVVFMVIYSGFLFIKAQGNESELQKAKTNLFWTLVGAVILIGAFTLAAVVESVARHLGVGII